MRNFNHSLYSLDGSWEFYQDTYCDTFTQTPDYITVPVSWNERENEALGMPRHGKATYRLQLKLPRKGPYVFHIPPISSSYEFYVNGDCIASCGKLAKDDDKDQNQWKPLNALYYADTETLDLVIYISNYHLPNSGVVQSIVIGTYEHVMKDTCIQVTRSALFMGLLFGFGLYLILLYKKRTNTACLYVGIFCLSGMILEGFIGSYINSFFFPYVKYSTMLRLEYISYLIVMMMLLLVCKEQYPKQVIKVVEHILLAINAAHLILLLLPIDASLNIVYITKYPLLVVNVSYILFTMMRASFARIRYALLSTISFIALLIGVFIDVLGLVKTAASFSKSGIYVVGIVIFCCTQMYILSRKSVDMYEQADRAKEMEIAYLQAQIAPHFFFNTLNNVYSLSTQSIEDAQKLLLAFCTFLKSKYRYDYREHVTCTLEHELSILASFIEIENYRFNNKIHFETDVDEEYLSITIPQLILQPLVENAIKHGFTNKDLTIRVSCQKAGDMLRITVHDDGKGMGRGYAASLLTSESKGVGLKNVADVYKNTIRQTLKYPVL